MGFYTIEEWSVFGSMVARSIHAMLQVKIDLIAGLLMGDHVYLSIVLYHM